MGATGFILKGFKMQIATLKIPAEEAEQTILKIMYRKKKAKKEAIETSFRRSVDSAGLSVDRVLLSALNKLTTKGNLKVDNRNGAYKWVTGSKL